MDMVEAQVAAAVVRKQRVAETGGDLRTEATKVEDVVQGGGSAPGPGVERPGERDGKVREVLRKGEVVR
ncbi:hypothetical protein MRB53_030806 [Persea americana]|uniref:Uncharacterized protein n=1 Tax=Persea americana TaxID=3435 RepID=A0ACC2KNA9_PERAE|nr:hypothetical protein MRB53_030806 [Persea americana]